jgi:hypothetical protein
MYRNRIWIPSVFYHDAFDNVLGIISLIKEAIVTVVFLLHYNSRDTKCKESYKQLRIIYILLIKVYHLRIINANCNNNNYYNMSRVKAAT